MAKQKEQRSILILVRYKIKKDYAPKGLHRGDVVLLVRNSEGKEYYTTLRKNHHHSCQCKNHQYRPQKECYHITFCKSVENARIEARKAAKVAQQVVETPAQPVVSPVVEEYVMPETLRAKLASFAQQGAAPSEEERKPTPIKRDMLDAPLNGNRSFELLMVS